MPRMERIFTEQDRIKSREARKLATPKRAYQDAIAAKCLECVGFSPTENHGCGGDELVDHKPCRLYGVNTWDKRRAATKPVLKRSILQECMFCMNGNDVRTCTSPHCSLYPFGPGRPPYSRQAAS